MLETSGNAMIAARSVLERRYSDGLEVRVSGRTRCFLSLWGVCGGFSVSKHELKGSRGAVLAGTVSYCGIIGCAGRTGDGCRRPAPIVVGSTGRIEA